MRDIIEISMKITTNINGFEVKLRRIKFRNILLSLN